MGRFSSAIAFIFLLMNAPAATVPFYLGTYTHDGKSKGIYRGTLDTETGVLGPIVLAGEAEDPSFLALSSDGKFLYAAIEKGPGSVASFAVRADGLLTPLNIQPTGGEGTCHVSVDAAGKRVYAANYNGGSVASFPVAADGSLGARDGFVEFTGSGPNRDRQEKPHAHSIYPFGSFVYACDLGTDTVHAWTAPFADDRPAQVPSGAGARHLAFSADGRFVYAVNEMACSTTTFSRDPATGALRPLGTGLLLPSGSTDDPATKTAEIVLHPSGRWLYVSVRGKDLISSLRVTDGGSRVEGFQETAARVKTPRSIAIDPSGHWLLAAGQRSDQLAVFRIDATTGALSPNGEPVTVGAPVSIVFAAKH